MKTWEECMLASAREGGPEDEKYMIAAIRQFKIRLHNCKLKFPGPPASEILRDNASLGLMFSFYAMGMLDQDDGGVKTTFDLKE